MRPTFLLRETLTGVRRHTGTFLAIVVTTAIALTMLGGALMMRAQIGELKGYWYDKTEVAVFLTADADTAAVATLGNQLTADPLVEQVYFEDQQEAYRHFTRQFRSSPELVREVTPEQLPRSFRIKLVDPAAGKQLAAHVAGNTAVRQVVDEHAQLASLFRVLGGFQNFALILAAVQALAAVVLIGNMIRSAVVLRRRELAIGRLMGASRPQLALPFLSEVALAGLAGTAVAAGMLAAAKWQLVDVRLRTSHVLTGVVGYIGWDAVYSALPWLVVTGIGMPVAVAAVVLRKHLKV